MRRARHAPWRSLALCLLLCACAGTHGPEQTAPELALAPAPAQAWPQMVATAHPQATRAALAVLAQGGAAIDAAIAAQAVLGLVEPQSSGLGGGALAMHWDAARQALTSWDGLAAAPSRSTRGLTVDVDGRLLDSAASRHGGRSVGVPGALALLTSLHQRHGKLPWASLFASAITLADEGFALAPYLHSVLSGPNAARDHLEMRGLYFGADGRVLPVGSIVRNPAYAKTLRSLASLGAQGWLRAGAAQDIVAASQRGYRASLMTEADVLAYQAEPREPLCAPFQRWRVCVMGPSSYGGVVVLQMLGMLGMLGPLQTMPIQRSHSLPSSSFNFDDAAFVHAFIEAGRLAQADRLLHLGDPAFVKAPLAALLDPAYLETRAAGIDITRRAESAQPGVPAPQLPGVAVPEATTSQIAIADSAGNALSITTTINLNFGSRLMVGGYVLNNAMTNFSPEPPPEQTRENQIVANQMAANRMAPNKRPVTSMAPTMVFDERGQPVLVGGSAGGGQIVDYIAQALIDMLAQQRTPQQALARGHVSTAVPGTVQLERGTPVQGLAKVLTEMGHQPVVTEMTSGLAFIQRTPQGWIGAADPRRDGVALGQWPPSQAPPH